VEWVEKFFVALGFVIIAVGLIMTLGYGLMQIRSSDSLPTQGAGVMVIFGGILFLILALLSSEEEAMVPVT
jgi:hypothetical protein